MLKQVIILWGPPGSGKGTVSQYFQKKHSCIKHISLGSICRQYAAEDNPLGREIKNTIDAGNLVGITLIDKIIKKIFDNFINSNKENILILDGYPRNEKQFASFLDIYQNYVKYFNYYIYLFVIDKPILLERLLSRYVCSNNTCDRIFNFPNIKNKTIVCNNCSSLLIKRKDDEDSIIQKRLDIYFDEEKSIIKLLNNKLIPFIKINANQKIENIYQNMIELCLLSKIFHIEKA